MKSTKCKTRVLLTGFALFLALGCEDTIEEKGKCAVVDDRGIEVRLSATPERVVSLVPSVTEVIFALGAEEKLVGVTTFCNYPPEAKLRPKVGDFSNPSLERIVSLKPQVVFATMPEQRPIAEKLENLGLRVFFVQPESVDGILSSIQKVGKVLAKGTVADSLVRELRDGLDCIERLTSNIKRRRVYVEIAANPLMTATDNSFVGELVALAGGINIGKGPKPYVVINPERIVRKNPQVIILAHPVSTPEEVKKRIGWEEISAVRENRICEIDPDLVLRPGPRIAEGARELLEKIHPEVVGQTGE